MRLPSRCCTPRSSESQRPRVWSGRARGMAEELGAQAGADSGEPAESRAFLRWLAEDHFTFLGYREYQLLEEDARAILVPLPESGLGILRGAPRKPRHELSSRALEVLQTPEPLILTKANSRATVHRSAYLDYVGVKRFDA